MLAHFILAAFFASPGGLAVELHGGYATHNDCRAAIAALAATLPPGADAGCITPEYIAAQRAYAAKTPAFTFTIR